MFREDQPVSEGHLSQERLSRATIRLCAVVDVHSHFDGENQIVGKSMIVGRRIFSIVKGLGIEGGLNHGSGLWQLAGRVRC